MFGMTLRSRARVGLLLGVGFLVASADPAGAQDRRVRIINETGYSIREFYASNVGSRSWEENILGTDVLGPGDSVVIDFDDNTGHCMFDFRAIFSDGDEMVRERVHICDIATFRYY
jgi:hypothetical protein